MRRGYTNPLVVVSDNTPVYENFFLGLEEGFTGTVTKEKINSDITLIRALATKIAKGNYDVVVFYTAPTDGALLVKELVQITDGTLPQFAFDQSVQ